MPLSINFSTHNDRVRKTWDSYNAGTPIKAPAILGISPEWMLSNRDFNRDQISMKDYLTKDDLMFDLQVGFEDFRRTFIIEDSPKGLPEDGWTLNMDYCNYLEPALFGAEVHYFDGFLTADAKVVMTDDNKRMLFDAGLPDPFGGVMADVRRRYEYFLEKKKSFSFRGKPVKHVIPMQTLSTAGPITTACNIRGADTFCLDLMMDPAYAQDLLDFITQANIARVKAWRALLKETQNIDLPAGFGMGDDSIALISTEQYIADIMPHHVKIYNELAGRGPRMIHLCGDATRHFSTIVEKLGVREFDTGFPVAHAQLCRQLGPDVRINGGPTAAIISQEAPPAIQADASRILRSGVNKMFVLREGNNMPPGTPIENINSLYAASMACAWKPSEVPGYSDFIK